MLQVPRYLLIGNGRVARHFRYYFSLLHLSFDTWTRAQPLIELHQKVSNASHILLLINDHAIDEFIINYLKNSSALHIHFSGSFVSSLAYGAHPLMTFCNTLYHLEQYHSFSFVIDDDAPAFEKLLPGINNHHVRLPTSLKAKYHALCVLSGNFSCLLWQKFFSSLENEFNLPAAIAYPYLKQQIQNILNEPRTALTGPLQRNDIDTIKKNLRALNADPFQEVYQSFVACFFNSRSKPT